MSGENYTGYACEIDTTVLECIMSHSYERQVQLRNLAAAGDLYTRGRYPVGIDHGGSIECHAAHTLLGLLDDSSAVVSARAIGGDNGSVTLYQALEAGGSGGYASGSVHTSHVFSSGLMWLAGLRADAEGILSVACQLMGSVSGGGSSPVTESQTDDLPTRPDSNELYRLFSLSINSVDFYQIDSYDLTIDCKPEARRLVGDFYPNHIQLGGPNGVVEHTLTAEVRDVGLAAAIAEMGAEGAVTAVFKNLTRVGSYGSDTVTVTLSNAHIRTESISASAGGKSPARITAQSQHVSSTAPLTITLSA